MKFRTMMAAVLMAGLGVGSVYAAAEGTKDQREAIMKKIGGSLGALSAIAKGQKPYDEATVKTALATISENAKAFPAQFGENSDKTDKSVNPKLWENLADFKARSEKLGSDADTILAQLPADQAGVGKAVATLGANCGACHKAYRLSD